jgi:DNA-binding transcriptional MerR regulator
VYARCIITTKSVYSLLNRVNQSGYRLYTNKELERLQQILFFREIGFSLQEIKEILESPEFDRKQALEAHKELLLEIEQQGAASPRALTPRT